MAERSLYRTLTDRYPDAKVEAGRVPNTLNIYWSGLLGSVEIFLEGKKARPRRVLFTRSTWFDLHRNQSLSAILDQVDELREQERALRQEPEPEPAK